jgi:hypothetical protein
VEDRNRNHRLNGSYHSAKMVPLPWLNACHGRGVDSRRLGGEV